ncbi:MAG: carbon monoxide dehydrogenase [Betaproteobacteria bacterium]|nr:carbon monoxide dehydrogenase [Betaproteobacteria bacterium]
MELNGEQLIPASQQRTWDALNDPEVLKACIPGCETLERTDDGGFTATLALRIGPVSAKFKGRLALSDVQAPERYTIHFDGQGGMAGFGKGSAQVQLAPVDGGTRLQFAAKAQVGGKLAQVGSRLVDAAAGKITNDFFNAFNARVQADAQAAGEVVSMNSPAPLAPEDAEQSNQPHPPSSPAQPAWLWWAVAAVAAAIALVTLAA